MLKFGGAKQDSGEQRVNKIHLYRCPTVYKFSLFIVYFIYLDR